MATWMELKHYIEASYRIDHDGGDYLSFVFEFEGGRSQIATVHRVRLPEGQEEWVRIDSPIGTADSVDLVELLEAVGQLAVGGLKIHKGELVLTDALPLANLDANEFDRPFLLVRTAADQLERQFFGKDDF